MSKATTAFFALFLVGSVSAQTITHRGVAAFEADHVDGDRIHLTHLLANSPRGQASLDRFHDLKKRGLSPAPKRTSVEKVGSVLGFRVWNYQRQAYDELEFTLKVQASRFDIWVETAELDAGRVNDDDIEALRSALDDATPAASFDPARGIIDLDEEVFGDPTDVDQNGKTDVLVLDIRDGYDPNVGGASIQGFVDPNNVSGVNLRDILHLDTFPSLAPTSDPNNLYLTAAHEFQHLIRFNYDPTELTFVDEGMSEWAEVMTGYGPRRNTYWSSASELRRPLLGFRGALEPGVDFDYQRAGLLTNYIAQRIGVLATGAITRSAGNGAAGYSAVLAAQGLDFVDVLADFHITNTINDAAVDAIYSQGSWFPDVSAAPRLEYDGTAQTTATVTADGNGANESPLEPGAVVYHRFVDVEDYSIELDALPGAGSVATNRDRIRAFLVADAVGSVKTVTEITPGGEPLTLSGTFADITLVVAHVDASLPGGFNSSWVPFTYSSSWTEGNIGSSTETVLYDDGIVVHTTSGGGVSIEAYPFPDGSRMGSRFLIPPGGTLSGVQVANLYANQFQSSGVPANSPRDFSVQIHTPASNGTPGPVVLEVESTDTAPAPTFPPGTLGFQDVDLTPYHAQLTGLSDTLYVTIGNAGTDTNLIYFPVSEYTSGESPSFLYLFFNDIQDWAWSRFSTVTNRDGDTILAQRVSPIRASFTISTASEDEPVLPTDFVLEPNYPNPFNPRTSIGFQLPAAGPTRLAVYDMLGREVAVLIDGITPAGRHEAVFDASRLASGLYLYALEVGNTRLTRSMVLLK